MTRAVLGGTLAIVVAAAAPYAAAQPSSASAAQGPSAVVTVEGCVTREADVPGREPNVAERAGITEDYLLTRAKVVKGAAPGAAAARPGDAPIGTSGTQAMFEIEGIDEDRLKSYLNRRVQIDGTFENVDRATASPERDTPADDLVEIRGTAIRPVAGDCPAR